MFDEVITTEAYRRLLKKAINPKVHKAIGPIKREDDSLAVLDDENANVMINYFAARLYVRSLSDALPQTRYPVTRADKNCIVTATIQSLNLPTNRLNNKVTNIMANRSTGPNGTAPKLIRLAEAIIAPSTDPYLHSTKISTVYNNWKNDRLTPVFKNDYETNRSNLRPLSILSMPSKIMDSCINDTMVEHVY